MWGEDMTEADNDTETAHSVQKAINFLFYLTLFYPFYWIYLGFFCCKFGFDFRKINMNALFTNHLFIVLLHVSLCLVLDLHVTSCLQWGL